MVPTANLPLIDRGFVLHRKVHGQKGTVRGSLGGQEEKSKGTLKEL